MIKTTIRYHYIYLVARIIFLVNIFSEKIG